MPPTLSQTTYLVLRVFCGLVHDMFVICTAWDTISINATDNLDNYVHTLYFVVLHE